MHGYLIPLPPTAVVYCSSRAEKYVLYCGPPEKKFSAAPLTQKGAAAAQTSDTKTLWNIFKTFEKVLYKIRLLCSHTLAIFMYECRSLWVGIKFVGTQAYMRTWEFTELSPNENSGYAVNSV